MSARTARYSQLSLKRRGQKRLPESKAANARLSSKEMSLFLEGKVKRERK
jgi:hypothetical protein